MKKAISTTNAPAAIGPYSQAIKIGNFIYTSGQLPMDAISGEMVEGNIEGQTRQVLANVRAVLEAAGASMADVVKTTVFLDDMENFAAMNGVYAEFFDQPFPARSAVQVAALPKRAAVEIEAVASLAQKDN